MTSWYASANSLMRRRFSSQKEISRTLFFPRFCFVIPLIDQDNKTHLSRKLGRCLALEGESHQYIDAFLKSEVWLSVRHIRNPSRINSRRFVPNLLDVLTVR